MIDYKRNRIRNQRLKRNSIRKQTKKFSFIKNKYIVYFTASVCGIFLLLFLLLKFIPQKIVKIDLFKTRDIRVVGNRNISEDDAKKLSGVEGKNFLTLNLQEAARRVLKDPWVKGVDLRRRFPNRISIAIEERSPFAYLQLTNLNLIDENCVILQRADSVEERKLPIITGLNETTPLQPGDNVSFPNLRNGIEALKEISSRNLIPASDILTLDVKDSANTVLTLKNSPGKIYLGTGDLEEKFKKLNAYLADRNKVLPLAGQVSYIDLRFKERVIIMPIEQAGHNKGDSL